MREIVSHYLICRVHVTLTRQGNAGGCIDFPIFTPHTESIWDFIERFGSILKTWVAVFHASKVLLLKRARHLAWRSRITLEEYVQTHQLHWAVLSKRFPHQGFFCIPIPSQGSQSVRLLWMCRHYCADELLNHR